MSTKQDLINLKIKIIKELNKQAIEIIKNEHNSYFYNYLKGTLKFIVDNANEPNINKLVNQNTKTRIKNEYRDSNKNRKRI